MLWKNKITFSFCNPDEIISGKIKLDLLIKSYVGVTF